MSVEIRLIRGKKDKFVDPTPGEFIDGVRHLIRHEFDVKSSGDLKIYKVTLEDVRPSDGTQPDIPTMLDRREVGHYPSNSWHIVREDDCQDSDGQQLPAESEGEAVPE